MAYDYSAEILEEYQNEVPKIIDKISGLIGSLRTDAAFGKRTNDNADEIIGYLEMISEALGALT
jgi:uncharacterized protein YozE (UPF0346 family)